MTPARELAFQISEQFEALGASIGLKCGMLSFENLYLVSSKFTSYLYKFVLSAVIVGGMDMMTQSIMLAKKPHVVIGALIIVNLL